MKEQERNILLRIEKISEKIQERRPNSEVTECFNILISIVKEIKGERNQLKLEKMMSILEEKIESLEEKIESLEDNDN